MFGFLHSDPKMQHFVKISAPGKILSPSEYEWLSGKDSLTQKLYQATDYRIRLVVIQEGWDKADWRRQIEWRLDDKRWISANLFIPASSINADTRCLLAIGNEPIGKILFQDPSTVRQDFEFYQSASTHCWRREAVILYKQQPLTLTETFYPSFFEYINHDACLSPINAFR